MNDKTTILAVDDTTESLALLIKTLTSAGYQVRPADSGELALAAVAATPPDLILLDICMPGMDGLEVCRRLKAHGKTRQIPIILMSADPKGEDWRTFLEVGAVDYIAKPFQREELLARVQTHLDLSRTHNLLEQQAVALRQTNEQLHAEVLTRQSVEAELRRSLDLAARSQQATLRTLEDQQKAEEALRASEVRYSSLFSILSSGVVVTDDAGQIVDANPASERILGLTRSETVERTFDSPAWSIVRPNGTPMPADEYASVRAMREGRTVDNVEMGIRQPDGTLRWLLTSASPVPAKRLGVCITFTDITERKAAEEALRLSSERLQLATRVAKIGIWDWDIPKNELVWDDSMYQLYGIRREDFGGAYDAWISNIHPEDKARTEGEIQAALRGEREYAPEFRIVRTDGAIRHIKAESRTIKDREGRPLRMIGTNIDITERKQAEEEIRKLNAGLEQRVRERTVELTAANQELESFSFAVSHDLRAPLRSMIGFSQALVEDCGPALPDESREHLRHITAAAQRMRELVDGLLTLSLCTRGGMRRDPIDLSALSERIRQELTATEPARKVEWQIQPGLTVRGDASMFEVVMRNLLGNAWKYTAKQPKARIEFGRVVVAADCDRRTDEAESTNGGHRPPLQPSTFFVSDNGAGFDMKHADALFKPFQRLHRQDEFPGIGIGLATVQRILHRHGGTIHATAAPGQGATFSFSLPETTQTERQPT